MYRRYYHEEDNRKGVHCCAYFLIILTILSAICLVSFVTLNANPFSLSKMLAEIKHEQEVMLAFEDFKREYVKTYDTIEEENARKEIFKANYERIIATNKEQNSFQLGVNKFADLTQDEFRAMYLAKPEFIDLSEFKDTPTQDHTDNLDKDWDKEGYMNPIRDQGNCGSCWAFAAVSAAEAVYAIKNAKKLLSFSEQELVDCINTQTSNGCNGGERWEALEYIAKNGIVSRDKYPYVARDEKCKREGHDKTKPINGSFNLTKGKNKELAEEVVKRPVSIGVNASPFNFMFYREGILDKACPHDEINHAVVAVGVGNKDGKLFWKIRNSWGSNWGEGGHIRIERDTGDSPGLCGVAVKACAPVA